jgi:hypothetical protein
MRLSIYIYNCVCVCMQMYVYPYIYIYIYTHTHTYIYIYLCVVHTHLHVVHVYLCTRAHAWISDHGSLDLCHACMMDLCYACMMDLCYACMMDLCHACIMDLCYACMMDLCYAWKQMHFFLLSYFMFLHTHMVGIACIRVGTDTWYNADSWEHLLKVTSIYVHTRAHENEYIQIHYKYTCIMCIYTEM